MNECIDQVKVSFLQCTEESIIILINFKPGFH